MKRAWHSRPNNAWCNEKKWVNILLIRKQIRKGNHKNIIIIIIHFLKRTFYCRLLDIFFSLRPRYLKFIFVRFVYSPTGSRSCCVNAVEPTAAANRTNKINYNFFLSLPFFFVNKIIILITNFAIKENLITHTSAMPREWKRIGSDLSRWRWRRNIFCSITVFLRVFEKI